MGLRLLIKERQKKPSVKMTFLVARKLIFDYVFDYVLFVLYCTVFNTVDLKTLI